eukprot:1340347-Pyramimonas_sp.AAC.1
MLYAGSTLRVPSSPAMPWCSPSNEHLVNAPTLGHCLDEVAVVVRLRTNSRGTEPPAGLDLNGAVRTYLNPSTNFLETRSS